MNRSDGFSMHCNLCERTFDSAAFMFLHFSEHVRGPENQNLIENLGSEQDNVPCLSTKSTDAKSAGTIQIDGFNNDRSGFTSLKTCKSAYDQPNSTDSSSPKEECLVNTDNNDCDDRSNVFPCSLDSSIISCNGGVSVTCSQTIKEDKELSTDESYEELDPSELCVTLIDEQENNNVGHSFSLSPENKLKINLPNNNSQKLRKAYSCRICSKKFGWSTDLKRHVLIHTGERPFKCKSCNASFTRNFLLQKHLSKVHPCNLSQEKLKCIEEGVELNLKLLRESFNIPKNVKSKA